MFHIKNQLSQNLGMSWSVQKMAKAVELSVPRFKQLFKEKTGIAPMAYLLEIRLEKARELLSDTHSFPEIKEIGVICGLTNASYLTREFKKRNGKTPSEYREHCSQMEQSALPDAQE